MSPLRADAIRARRRALGLSQRQLGAICGLNGTTVHRIETQLGAGKYLRLNHLTNLAAALDVDPAWLLTDPAQDPTDWDDSAASSATADAQTVGALLIGKGKASTQALAFSLGWSFDRVQKAVTALAGHLPTVGGSLRQQNGTVVVIAAVRQGAEEPDTRLNRLRLGTRSLNRDELRSFNEIRQPGVDPKRLDWLLRQPAARHLADAGLIDASTRSDNDSVLGADVYTVARVLAEHFPGTSSDTAAAEPPPIPSVVSLSDLRQDASLSIHPLTLPPPTQTDWAAVRRWARANGYPVGTHGGIRADVIVAFYRATSRPDGAPAAAADQE